PRVRRTTRRARTRWSLVASYEPAGVGGFPAQTPGSPPDSCCGAGERLGPDGPSLPEARWERDGGRTGRRPGRHLFVDREDADRPRELLPERDEHRRRAASVLRVAVPHR